MKTTPETGMQIQQQQVQPQEVQLMAEGQCRDASEPAPAGASLAEVCSELKDAGIQLKKLGEWLRPLSSKPMDLDTAMAALAPLQTELGTELQQLAGLMQEQPFQGAPQLGVQLAQAAAILGLQPAAMSGSADAATGDALGKRRDIRGTLKRIRALVRAMSALQPQAAPLASLRRIRFGNDDDDESSERRRRIRLLEDDDEDEGKPRDKPAEQVQPRRGDAPSPPKPAASQATSQVAQAFHQVGEILTSWLA
jgi:hypothetical protein